MTSVKKLLERHINHADLDATDANGDTALILATRHGHVEVVKLLLNMDGIDANKARTDDGRTPLYVASQKGHVEVVDRLIAAGANVNLAKKAGEGGETPLIMAAYMGNKAVVTALVKAGADQAVEDDDGKTAVEYGRDRHRWDDAVWQQ